MNKYEVKAIRHYSAVFLGDKRVTQWPLLDEDACKIVDMLNQETAPLLDELATKDAVILAQSERIKELGGVLKQIALNAPKSNDEINRPIHHNTVKNHALNFVYAGLLASIAIKPLAEIEVDNG